MSHATVTAARTVAPKAPVKPVTKTQPSTTVKTVVKPEVNAVVLKARLVHVVSKKEPNDLHKQYVAWIKTQTGFDADLKTVQVLLASYHDFQASPEKQKALTASKVTTLKAAEAKVAAARIKVLKDAKRLGITL